MLLPAKKLEMLMNPANLTRSECRLRSQGITTRAYQVTIDLTGRDLADPDTFGSTSTVTFASQAGQTWIDLIADSVSSAELDGVALDPSTFTGHRLPLDLTEGEHQLTVTALCRYSHTGEGLHRFVDPTDKLVYLYTQFETADSRRMFAVFEQPDLKATFQFTVLAPDHWTVISNARAVTPEPAGEAMARWTFPATPPVSSYITALIAGDYHVVEHTLDSVKGPVPASILCRQSVVANLDADRVFTTTQRGFAVFEQAFGGPYPFDSYDQIFVPEFNAGAMENAGCVTIRDEYLFRSRVTAAAYEGRDNTILHELAHMWFGDLVTMTWWDDLWLNESFAEWASHFCQSRIVAEYGGVDPWVGFANARKGWAYTQDQMPTTHPIAADMVDLEAVEQNFDGITYAKGASALKQLVSFVGEDAFLAGVQSYFSAHAWGNTQLADLLGALERSSGRDLSWFSGEWLEKAGVNTVVAEIIGDDTIGAFTVVQSADENWPTLRTHKMAIGLFDLVDDALVRRDSVPVEISGARTEVTALVGQKRPDLVLLNDGDLTYAKVRMDQRSLATAVAHIDSVDDPLARAIIWGAAWDMCRDAELAASDYVDLVLRGVGRESDLTAVGTLLRQAHAAATTYTSPGEARAAVRQRLVAGVAGLLKQAEPGSDHQLAFTNALVSAVHTSAGGELVAGWLKGEEVPEGLVIDTDLRWRIVTTLARMGLIDETVIAEELATDNTIAGAESAAGARAALPTAEAKAEAWRLATENASVPNGTHRAIAAQLWQNDQQQVLADYVDRYLDVCGQISRGEGDWSSRGHAAVQTVLTWLFPIDVDAEVLTRVDDWLSTNTPSEQVKRTVTERRDALARALRCQELG